MFLGKIPIRSNLHQKLVYLIEVVLMLNIVIVITTFLQDVELCFIVGLCDVFGGLIRLQMTIQTNTLEVFDFVHLKM